MPSRLRTRVTLIAVLAALTVPGTASAAFSVVPSPNAFSGDNMLNGVSASSATDAWAVGSLCCSIRNSGTGALTEHWDGNGWTVVLGPDARFQDETLNGVVDVAPSDVWAVGRVKQSGYSGGTPLILHWDGSSWQSVSPPSGVTGELRAVSSDALGGAWAVGDDGHGHALALRCAVATCSAVTVPQVGAVSRLRGITAFGQNDVWAVGDSGNATLAVHWDGATWSIVPTPDPDPKVNVLHAVAGVAGNDVWAVGRMAQNEADTGVPPGTRTLAMHWDGTTWQTVSTPNVDDQNSLTGIAATSPASVTAVGAFEDRSGDGAVLRTLGQRWNGSSWDTLGTPDVGTADNLLRSAAPIPGTADVWAVGEYRPAGGPVQTLVMRDSSATAPGVQSPPEQAPAASSEPTSMGEPTSANEPTPASQPTATSEQAPTGAAAAPGETCGPVRVTLALGKPGLRARRISVNAGGKKQLLRGPRKRVTVTVAYTRARQALLTVRIRGRAGELRMIRRTVSLCR